MGMIYRFGQLFNVVDGDRGKNYPKDCDFSDKGYCLFLNAGNVTKNGWSFEHNSFITEEKDQLLHNGRLTKENTVFTTRGTVGNAAYYGENIPFEHIRINSGMVILSSKDTSLIQNKFIYYLVTSPYAKKTIEMFCSGSAQPQLPIKDFVKIKFNLPSIEHQQKITYILSAYDDLIENNNKRIKILEQMAESFYKWWFSYDKIQKSSKLIRLDEIIKIVRGVSYSSEEIDVDGGIYLVNLKNIKAYGGFRRNGLKTYVGKYKKEQMVYHRDLIMGVTDMTQDRRTVGAIAIVPKIEATAVISADLIKIVSVVDNLFMYSMFKFGNVSKYVSQFANGANVLHLKPQVVTNIKVLLPEVERINKYVRIVDPIFEEIESLNQINNILVSQRDMLLPRLMSGKLEVK